MRLPSEVPVMTLSGVILFPQAMLPLYIYEPRYRKMLADSLITHRMFAVAMQRPERTRETPVSVAGLGLIRAAVTGKDGTSHLILQGLARVELTCPVRYRPYRVYAVRPLLTAQNSAVATQALAAKVLELVGERLDLGLELPFKALSEPLSSAAAVADAPADEPLATQAFREVLKQLSRLDDPEQLVDLVSATLLPEPSDRQLILETPRLDERLRYLVRFLMSEISRQKKQQQHE